MDLDGDGHLDILSGSWPGEIFLFRGDAKRNFADPIKLKNKDGKTINIGGGRRPDSGSMILIAGDAEFKKDDKGKQIVVYEGETIDMPPGKSVGITGTASSVFAVDWRGTGRLDLIVGDIGGNVYLVPNDGTKTVYAFGKEQHLEAEGKAVNVAGGDAGPVVADWDGDGKLDLIVGSGDGSVWFYRNIGTTTGSKLAAGVMLVTPGEAGFGKDVPKEPRRGVRAKVCVVDYDGDGKLDLLVGDFANQKPSGPDPTDEQKAEHERIRDELKPMEKRFYELMSQVHGDKIKDADERKKAEKEFGDINEKMSELRRKLPPEYENHGWVWFFKRK